jgi:hypothetical protein
MDDFYNENGVLSRPLADWAEGVLERMARRHPEEVFLRRGRRLAVPVYFLLLGLKALNL